MSNTQTFKNMIEQIAQARTDNDYVIFEGFSPSKIDPKKSTWDHEDVLVRGKVDAFVWNGYCYMSFGFNLDGLQLIPMAKCRTYIRKDQLPKGDETMMAEIYGLVRKEINDRSVLYTKGLSK